jgi:hypothetical protein
MAQMLFDPPNLLVLDESTNNLAMVDQGDADHGAVTVRGHHAVRGGNTNAVTIYAWKNGKQATILFAPSKPHPESGSST